MEISIKPERIKEAREALGWSQAKLAFEISKLAGDPLTTQTVSNWEREGGNSPSHTNLGYLCRVTGKSPNFFYDFKVDGFATNNSKKAA